MVGNNEIEYADYSKIDNLLVCGAASSGKTTFVRTLITSLISVDDSEKGVVGPFESMKPRKVFITQK